MASVCLSNCIEDARVPIRPTYINLYKWPESNAKFVESISSSNMDVRGARAHPKVVDIISCRQMYLRSYTFSKKETVPEKTKKCFGRLRRRVVYSKSGKRKRGMHKRAKKGSCASLFYFFLRLLYCTAKFDVVDHGDS